MAPTKQFNPMLDVLRQLTDAQRAVRLADYTARGFFTEEYTPETDAELLDWQCADYLRKLSLASPEMKLVELHPFYTSESSQMGDGGSGDAPADYVALLAAAEAATPKASEPAPTPDEPSDVPSASGEPASTSTDPANEAHDEAHHTNQDTPAPSAPPAPVIPADDRPPHERGASESGYEPLPATTADSHPQVHLDRLHSLIDSAESKLSAADAWIMREFRVILAHLGAPRR